MYDQIPLTSHATFHSPDGADYALHTWRAFARLDAGDPTGPTIARFQCSDPDGLTGWWHDLATGQHDRDVVALARVAIDRHRAAVAALEPRQ